MIQAYFLDRIYKENKMTETRILLNPEEQKKTIDIMLDFRALHLRIENLEKEIEALKEEKTACIDELTLMRADDEWNSAQLTEKYGPGKIDGSKLEWVITEE